MAFHDKAFTTTAGASLAATRPATNQFDDLWALLTVDVVPPATFSGPAGWAAVGGVQTLTFDGQVAQLWHLTAGAGPSEPSTYTFTASGGSDLTACVVSLSGRLIGSTSFAVQTIKNSSTATPFTAALTGGTSASGDDLVVLLATDPGSAVGTITMSTTGTPGTFVDRGTTAGNGSVSPLGLSTLDNVSAGASGTISAAWTDTNSVASAWAGWVISVEAAPAPTSTIAQKLGGLRSFSQARTSTPAIGASPGTFDSSMTSATFFDQEMTGQGSFDADLIEPTGNTIAQRLGGLRQSVTAAENIASTAAQRLGGLRQSVTASESIPATVAQRLGGLRQSVTAAETLPGTIAQRLGGLRQSVTAAETIASTAAQRLGGLRQSAAATETIPATAAQLLGGLRQSVTAAVSAGNTASIAQNLGGLRQSMAASQAGAPVSGTIAQRLGGLRQTAAASVGGTGTGAPEEFLIFEGQPDGSTASATSIEIRATVAIATVESVKRRKETSEASASPSSARISLTTAIVESEASASPSTLTLATTSSTVESDASATVASLGDAKPVATLRLVHRNDALSSRLAGRAGRGYR